MAKRTHGKRMRKARALAHTTKGGKGPIRKRHAGRRALDRWHKSKGYHTRMKKKKGLA